MKNYDSEIDIYKDDDNYHVKFNGDNFFEIKDILKYYNFKFNPKDINNKYWEGGKLSLYRSYNKLNNLGKITLINFTYKDLIDSFTKDDLAEENREPETEYFNFKINKDLLKYSPMLDKSNEPFQLFDIQKGINQSRLFLAHEMGLGKTYIMINIINHLVFNNLVDKIVIVAPGNSIYNWKYEFMRFNSFNLKEDDFYIVDTKDNRTPFDSNKKIIIMTYRNYVMLEDDFHKPKKNYRTSLINYSNFGNKENRLIVLDESHNVKGNSKQTKILLMNKDNFRFRYLLSGTPAPNKPIEFYNQFKFLDRSLVHRTYDEFDKSISSYRNEEKHFVIYDPIKSKEFLNNVNNWWIRRMTIDTINLPELIEKRFIIELNELHRSIYRSMVDVVLDTIKINSGEGVIYKEIVKANIFNTLAVLNDPCHFLDHLEEYEQRHSHSSYYFKLKSLCQKWKFNFNSKLDSCTELLEDYITTEKHKTILWSGHPKTMDRLKEYYKKYNPVVIYGGCSNEEKELLLNEFKTKKEHRLLIASYIVLSTAVTINESCRSIYFDRDFSFINYSQSIKRNHRIGQTNMVVASSLIIDNSLEVRQDKLLNQKKSLNDYLMGKFNKKDILNKEDLLDLFAARYIDSSKDDEDDDLFE